MYMSYRLAKWIENEFDRNSWFFAEFKGGLIAACDFIDYVLKDNDNFRLDEEDKIYIDKVRECYSNMKSLSNEMVKEINKYKEAFFALLEEDEFITVKADSNIKEEFYRSKNTQD